MADKVDLYAVLGVARDAPQDEIKRTFRRLAREFHPDVNPDPQAAEHFKEINLAYEVLSDPQKRQQYDAFGTTDGRMGMGMGGGFGERFGSFSDIFDFFFGGSGFGNVAEARRRGYHPGEDLHKAVHLTLTDCLQDKPVELSVERREVCEACGGSRSEPGSQPMACPTCSGRGVVGQVRETFFGRMTTTSTCPACGGEGLRIGEPCHSCRGKGLRQQTRRIEVTIPAGIEHGNALRLGGKGHSGLGGAPAGDLLVSVSVEPDERFERQGSELYMMLPVHYADLALGATVVVPSLEGQADLRIPAGTESHQEFLLRGQGMPKLRGGGRGNLHVHVVLEVPKRLSKRQRELLSQLRAEDQGQAPGGAPPESPRRRR
jgi:molecular chaperone DnaJ